MRIFIFKILGRRRRAFLASKYALPINDGRTVAIWCSR